MVEIAVVRFFLKEKQYDGVTKPIQIKLYEYEYKLFKVKSYLGRFIFRGSSETFSEKFTLA